MKNILFVIALAMLIAIVGCSDNNASDTKQKEVQASTVANEKSGDEVVWMNFDKGLAKAKEENKNMIVDFYTDWCHWCKVMDEKTFQNESVSEVLADKFITVRLNAEDGSKTATYKGKTYTNIELTRAFGVRGFPSIAFLDKQGEIITLVPGYVPAETFAYLLDYVEQECYKKQMSFDEFMKKKGECEDNTKT
ncbi:thioredoxin fold domain-containing protein [candidate division KSB1 bacterium]|nr:thioredoxin fold domain-containing protein [candidate division KSB1 bacterium]